MSETAAIGGATAETAVAPGSSGAWQPYRRSWVNAVTAWVDRLPGPAWAFYLAFTAFTVVTINGLVWVTGVVPTDRIDPAQTYYGILLPAALALIHYLDRVGRVALDQFLPATDSTDAEVARWRYELTVIPARPALVLTVATVLVTVAGYATDPVGTQVVGYSPIALAIRGVYESAIGSLLLILVYHSLRQLRLVSRIHALAIRVDLFQPGPLYAFSRLTSRTGIGLILLIAPTVFLIPSTAQAAVTALVWLAPVAIIAVATFVGPLMGMHRRIADEKGRLEAEVGRRIGDTMTAIHDSVDRRERADADALNKTLASLIAERELVGRLPTWPWQAGTLGAVVSAIVLPVALWFVTRFLERVV